MKKEIDPKKIRRIVVIRTDRIGEVVLSTPVVEALKMKFPDAKISFVTSPYASDVLSYRDDINEIIPFSTINKRIPFWKALILGWKLFARRFDMAVILNPHKMLHLAVFMAGIPWRVGFDRKWGFLLNRKREDTRNDGMMHELNYNLALLDTIGIKIRDIAPFINVANEDRDYLEILFGKYDIDWDKGIIIVNIGSSNPAKQWPLGNFTELIRRLITSNDLNVVMIGDKAERPLCEQVISEVGRNRVYNLAGLLTLRQVTALFLWADLIITNDNGPMHIAAALNKKIIAIFGRNIPGVSPKRWGPYGSGHIVFHKDPGCDPCLDRDCPYGFKCLTSITPDEVFEAVQKILK